MKHLARMLLAVMCAAIICASAAADFESYTVKLSASTEIYEGPGDGCDFARTVGEDGVYTIVEEAFDSFGNLWGRLKSGAGWVMLEAASAGYEYVYLNDVPYTTSLDASVGIYDAPGIDGEFVREVGEDGVYTIVEEAIGDDGFLWGRLKSGLGWVMLSDAAMEVPEYTVSDAPYTVSLGAWVPVYSAPGYEEGVCTGIVGVDGIYTIVSETSDIYGNIWGCLRSGAGWVDLNYVRTMGRPAVTAYHADIVGLTEDYGCDYIADSSEYMTRIAFRANEQLLNVQLTALRYEEDGYVVEKHHDLIPLLEEGAYYVAGVVFYGDMTVYGISFIDVAGEERCYAVSLSGMDGSVIMNEYFR